MAFIVGCVALTAMVVAVGMSSHAAAAGPAYARWQHGPPADPNYFPIAVWLQDPKNAPRYKAAGINLYVGLWDGPTDQQLADLKAQGMSVICDQNAVGLAHRNDPTIVGWMHGDEPDNAQSMKDPQTGQDTWGPCIPPQKIVDDYDRIRAKDPSRPVLLNLGQGVANDHWYGRGNGAKLEDYATYVKGGDVISFDVYPVAGLELPNPENYLWYVPKGVTRLVRWSEGRRIIWNCVECTHIGDADRQATPAQVRAEVWMALTHGSTGLIYFVHQFQPRFSEWALLDDPVMLPAVTAINHQIHELAPVLNSPTVAGAARVKSSNPRVPIAHMVKRHQGATYLFTVGMRNEPTTGTFTLTGLPATARVEVLGEDREIAVTDGKFTDDFAPYAVHLYRAASSR
jgi:hypothetical protein